MRKPIPTTTVNTAAATTGLGQRERAENEIEQAADHPQEESRPVAGY